MYFLISSKSHVLSELYSGWVRRISVSHTGDCGFKYSNSFFQIILFLSLNSLNSVKTFRKTQMHRHRTKLRQREISTKDLHLPVLTSSHSGSIIAEISNVKNHVHRVFPHNFKTSTMTLEFGYYYIPKSVEVHFGIL